MTYNNRTDRRLIENAIGLMVAADAHDGGRA